ncbi:MAG: hypothetical protein IT340_05610 [Chloroflexi bacterium]|nr:hypothetical protein [Chloroflexota bacterium]
MNRRWLVAHGVVVLALLAAFVPPVAAQPAQFANVPIQQLWERYDLPVVARQTDRQWTWGPNVFHIGFERYIESPGGQRQVQYFDKSRMELNNPATGVVTNGLLVRELVSGRMALGDVAFEQRAPASIGVAGDPIEVNPDAVSYADFANVASIDADRRAPNRTGQVVNQGMGTAGVIYEVPQATIDRYQQNHVRYALNEPVLGHNVANVFIDFMNQSGTLFVDGQFRTNQPVFSPWIDVMGLPITEPFWTRTRIAGQFQIVLVQLFERRALTYTPSNPPGAQVEMGNVGQHYFSWLTRPLPPPPPPPPPPLPNAPQFVNWPQRTGLTATTATIEWRTDVPTNSVVEFDTDANRDPFRNRAGNATSFRTTHNITLTGLDPSRVYFWRVVSEDRNGQRVPESNHSFRTLSVTGGGSTITQPGAGQRVSSPLVVTGQDDGTAFDALVVVRLRDPQTGWIYAERAAPVQGANPGQPGPFTATLFFAEPASDQPGLVEVVSISQNEAVPEQVQSTVNVTIAGAATPQPPPPPDGGGSNTITRPTHDQRVGSPLRVLGTVDRLVQNGNIIVNLRDRTTGAIVASQPGQANSRGEFDVLISYQSPAPNTPALVEIVAPEQTDGQRNVVKVTLQFIMA